MRGYERGFHLRNDYYNGINLAFLLNVRSDDSCRRAELATSPAEIETERAEAVACFIHARKVRTEVLSICESLLKENPAPTGKKATKQAMKEYLHNRYWVVATQAEAYLGLGQTAKANKTYREAYSLDPESWMVDSTESQRKNLKRLLAVSAPLKYVKAGAE